MPNIADRLSFWHLDGDFTVFSDGSLGCGFRLSGYDISCLTTDAINTFNKSIENLLVGSPEGSRLQVFYRLTGNIKEKLTAHEAMVNGATELYRPVAEARLSYFNENAKNKNYFVPEIYLFVRSGPLKLRKRRFFEKEKFFQEASESEYRTHKEKFERTLNQIESSLKQSRLEPARLLRDEWFALVFEYLNLSRFEKLGLPALRSSDDPLNPSLVNQLVLSNIDVKRDHLKIGDYYFRVITLKTLPDGFTQSSMVDQFTKLPFHFWISQNLVILNQRNEIEKMELGRRLTHSMVSGSKGISDLEGESRLSHIEELLRELHDGTERLISSDFNVIIWAGNLNELQEKTDEVLRSFRTMNQSEGLHETLPAIDAFVGAVPSACQGFRHKKMKSSNATHLMPLYANWRGNKNPVCLFPNREGSLFSIEPFARELPAWNGLVFGGTGSGKSFTICQLMLQFYAQTPRPRIIWIDNGASSQRLLEVLGGEFIDLNIDSGICLNMFDLEEGEMAPSPTKIKLILGVLELILKDDDTKGIPKREKALLEEAIFKVYTQKSNGTPTLGDLKAILEAHDVSEMKKFSQILFSWTGQTAYGRLLDNQTNVKLNRDLITIEIKGLDNHRELKDIFLLLFTNFIKTEAARDLATPYLLIIDEAARLFLTPSGKDFAIECYRTFRKYNAGIYCISQNYRDFLSDQELADALMPNTTNVFILRQRKIDWNDFKTAFDFNDAQVEAIKSLQIEKGKFSEFFFMQDENQTILRLMPDPLSYWICTSDGNDKAMIQEMENKYPDVEKIEILKMLAKKHEEAA